MIFQLTTAGRALINTQGLALEVTKVEYGDAYDYVPANEPAGLTGTKVYQSNAVFSPVATDPNTLRFTTFLPANVGPFTFGEIALWAGSTLLGVGASVVPVTKVNDTSGAQYRVDVFLDLLSGQRFASWEVVSSFTRNFFPRLPSPDVLPPPAFDTNNVYVIYGNGDYKSAYLAFSDLSGKWSFSAKPRTWFQGTISAVGANGLDSSALQDLVYFGAATDLVVQFTDGSQRGICRHLSTLVPGSAGWSTPLEFLPSVGDSFVVLGPYIGDQFTGQHESLDGLQGGQSGQHYHLTQIEHDRVDLPRFKSVKTVSVATYSVLDADDDAFITLTNASVTITLDDTAFTAFPAGGIVTFRYVNAAVAIQVAGSTHIIPYDTINIPQATGTFALVKRAANVWDYIATVAEDETFDGNVRHKYPADGGSLSPATFVPMYAPNGDEDGPVTDVTSSKLSLSSFGGMRVWPGVLTTTPVWNAPAFILIGVGGGPSGLTSTGLTNDSTSYTCTGTVNGTAFSISILGSQAQNFTNLLSQFNTQLWAALGSNTIASLTLNGYGLVFSTDGTGDSQSIVLTTTNLFDNIFNVVPKYRLSHTGQTGAVNALSIYLNAYDSATNNNRLFRAGFGTFISGLQNSASGLSGFSIGGAYNLAAGSYSGILGGTTNRVTGFYTQILSGYGNVIQPHPSLPNNIPQFSSIQNSDRSLIETKNTSSGINDVPVFVTLNATRRSTVTGAYCTIQTSQQIVASGLYASVMGSQLVTIAGSYVNIFGSTNITATADANNITVMSSDNVSVTGSFVSVIGGKNQTVNQSNVLVFPNGVNNSLGKPGYSAVISTGAYGSGSTLPLTTDGGALSSTNRINVPNGEAWTMDSTVTLNYPTGFKSWKLRTALKNIAGTVTILAIESETVGGINGQYMEINLVTGGTGNTDKIHLTVNTRNDTNTGYETVSCAAVSTISAARQLT